MKELLVSRKFWALVIGLVVLLVGQFSTSFQLNEEATVALVVVVASYILGVSVDPGPGGWRGVLQSRKFWASAVGLVVVVLNGFGIKLPEALPSETLIWLCGVLGTYVAGVALESKFKPVALEAINLKGGALNTKKAPISLLKMAQTLIWVNLQKYKPITTPAPTVAQAAEIYDSVMDALEYSENILSRTEQNRLKLEINNAWAKAYRSSG